MHVHTFRVDSHWLLLRSGDHVPYMIASMHCLKLFNDVTKIIVYCSASYQTGFTYSHNSDRA